MEKTFAARFKRAWNVFLNRDPTDMYASYGDNYGTVSYRRPDKPRSPIANERSIINAIFNKIAVDAASVDINHIDTDADGRFLDIRDSELNDRFNLEANIDQTGRAFRQDIFMSMLTDGVVALVPIDTDDNPDDSEAIVIDSIRVSKIVAWMPHHVKVNPYNERTGRHQEIVVNKSNAAIIENPFYTVFNEPNSTLQRLLRKLALLDAIDEQQGSGKLDLIIQLPYVVKSSARQEQAEKRRNEIEEQLSQSKFGIAYTDGTEHITQLNRPVENNLMSQIEYLTKLLFTQLNLSQEILDGTANQESMTNYYSRTIEPLLSAVVDEVRRKFLTKTARSQGQDVRFFRDPFKLLPVDKLADIADRLTRNEIMTSNEIRQKIGLKPSNDPNADVLRNKNISQSNASIAQQFQNGGGMTDEYETDADYDSNMQDLDGLDTELDDLENSLAQSEDFFDDGSETFADDSDPNDILEHYASPYYDPVKAHEYYEEHKKLKGRHSTADLSDEGKIAASYIRKRLNEERDAKIETHKNQTNASIKSETDNRNTNVKNVSDKLKSDVEKARNDANRKVEAHKRETQSVIKSLQAELANMSPSQKRRAKRRIQTQINKLRETNSEARKELMGTYKNTANQLRTEAQTNKQSIRDNAKTNITGYRDAHRTTKQQLKDEYDQKYEAELESLRSDRTMRKK